jgi:protein-disulfide isomerase/uncharacterized membrane protein
MQDKFYKNKNFIAVCIAIVIALGLLDSVKLYTIDLDIWSGAKEAPSFCNVSEYINCDAAVLSEYSDFWGIPTSVFGIAFYLALLLIQLFALFSSEDFKKHLYRVIFLSGLISSILSLWLAYLLIYKVKALCLLCLGSYIVNFAISVLSFFYLKEGIVGAVKNYISDVKSIFFPFNKASTRHLAVLIVVLVFWAGTIFGLLKHFEHQTQKLAIDQNEIVKRFLSIEKQEVNLSRSVRSWGNTEAKVKIVEFSDLLCPFCKKAGFLIKNMITPYKDKVELIFKNFPLDSSCNKSIGGTVHPKACLLAKSAICADKYEKFWDFNEFFFENGKDLGRQDILDLAKTKGIDTDEYEKCIDGESSQRVIDTDIMEAKVLNINQTPTLIINGRVIRGLLPPKILQVIIEYELSQVK